MKAPKTTTAKILAKLRKLPRDQVIVKGQIGSGGLARPLPAWPEKAKVLIPNDTVEEVRWQLYYLLFDLAIDLGLEPDFETLWLEIGIQRKDTA